MKQIQIAKKISRERETFLWKREESNREKRIYSFSISPGLRLWMKARDGILFITEHRIGDWINTSTYKCLYETKI